MKRHVEDDVLELECNTPLGADAPMLQAAIKKKLGRKQAKEWGNGTFRWVVLRKSIDARKKDDVHEHWRLALLHAEEEAPPLARLEDLPLLHEAGFSKACRSRDRRPVVVGLGPAGLFSAYLLSVAGCRPIIVEQGKPVEARAQDVQLFWREGTLHPWSNVQFGEGGAGTFSDGKLHTGVKSEWIRFIFDTFVQFGAPEEIRYDAHPHIGTDRLPEILAGMRQAMEALGATFLFEHQMIGLERNEGRIRGVRLRNLRRSEEGEPSERRLETDAVFLGIGHSSRRTYMELAEEGVPFEAKPMAVGVRIEHPQQLIDVAQYGAATVAAHRAVLPASPYKLTMHTANGRVVYSFCMCPGGEVIASASAPEQVVTNGMSKYARSEYHANSALLVNITPDDYAPLIAELEEKLKEHPAEQEPEQLRELRRQCRRFPALRGLLFQEMLEHLAYLEGGSDYHAPSMSVGAWMAAMGTSSVENGDPTRERMEAPTYQPGVRETDLRRVLPHLVAEALTEALPQFARKIHGYANAQARLYAVESRSSAPVRILRGRESRQSEIAGLYPIGEGAGYAGGITSSAVDGMKSAYLFLEGMAHVSGQEID